MSQTALAFENASFAYGNRTVLTDVNLSLSAGEMVALMGPSGCGKSTLLEIAVGLRDPSSGHVTRNYRRAAIMFQDARLLPWRTAQENVAFALKVDHIPISQAQQQAEEILAAVELSPDHFRCFPRQLSGGMRQRVALARALVIKPDLLLLDEPFSALDRDLAEQMLWLVKKLAREQSMSVLLVTHDRQEAEGLADKTLLLPDLSSVRCAL
ncbi:ABC transporter ATP-binding protein [Cohaesibacter celericrescens]|uniref:Sulfate ABC transporter ATP-binding protein n=1 Tax=Cohaesibacter celericrescens TaxID=2067669 RepID=A0A2N5XPU5_9HYPH|nr:ATP-binding cassette domain-containing protein [Cohaesibacter celericrescens]PLW76546.1 sulfate ABC transporter ATP-binding protein [Cohaesibacter celericrescens]